MNIMTRLDIIAKSLPKPSKRVNRFTAMTDVELREAGKSLVNEIKATDPKRYKLISPDLMEYINQKEQKPL